MADPKKTDPGLDAILSTVGDEEPVDLDTLAEEAPEFGAGDGDPELLAELEAARRERDDFRDKFMRALADAENARKRGDKDRREAEHYGGTRLARDLLPVYDNLNRALAAVTDEQRGADTGVIEGIELTIRELLNVLEKHGVTKVTPQKGDRFDPKVHQAMFEAPVQGTRAGEIIEVMTEGFMLHERLLRPAQVGVSSNTGG